MGREREKDGEAQQAVTVVLSIQNRDYLCSTHPPPTTTNNNNYYYYNSKSVHET
jgi:hypothetical protein